MAVYRGVDPTNPIDGTPAAGYSSNSASVTAPSITTSNSSDELLNVHGIAGNTLSVTWTAPTGMNEEVQASTSLVGAGIADQTLGGAGTTGSRTASIASSQGSTTTLVGVNVALRHAVTSFAYDPRGIRTGVTLPGGTTTNLTYDEANRLTGVGTNISYAYDGDGLRASKTVASATSRFTWDTAEGTSLLLSDDSNYYVCGPGGTPLEQIPIKTITLVGAA